MNLLFISHRRDFSGGEICLQRILERLRGHGILVVLPEGLFAERLRGAGIAVQIENELRPARRAETPFSLLGVGARFAGLFGRLRRTIREFRAHLVISNGMGPLPYAGPAARWAGVPNIFIHHGPVFQGPSSETRLVGLASKFCDGILTVSLAVQEGLRFAGVPPRKIKTIYNGLDPSEFAPGRGDALALRRDLRLAPEVKLIGLVATIVEWKGHHVVIEAARRLRDKFPVPVPWRIVFVGEVFEGSQVDAAYKAGLEEQVRRDGLEDLVLFAGRKTDMPGVYAGLDVVLNASVEPEPLGTTIYEAMAMGRPVVVSNLGGSPEIVDGGRAGYLVPAGDSQELARTLAAVLQGPAELPSLVAAARRRVEDCFDLAKTVEQYERYFASFAKKG